LNHIVERDKLQIRNMKLPISNKKEDMRNILNSLKSVAELKKQMMKDIDKVKENKKGTDVATDDY
jgi:hypothetical protein